MRIDLQICIVSFNTSSLLEECLRSIFSQNSKYKFEVTVVDNGSSDDSIEMVYGLFPNARVVESGGNIGYGRANNLGLLRAPGRYYLVLNSDTVVREGAIDLLVKTLDSRSNLGAVGGALLEPNGEPQRNWAVGELTLSSIFYEQFFLSKMFPKSPFFSDYFRPYWNRESDDVVPQICGACLMTRAELFNKLGGFDAAIFMYAEDTDLCKRIRGEGFEVGYIAGAKITHHHGKSSEGELRPRMIFEHNRSRIYYFNKHEGVLTAWVARCAMAAGAALRSILWRGAGALGRTSKATASRNASSFWKIAILTAKTNVDAPTPPTAEETET